MSTTLDPFTKAHIAFTVNVLPWLAHIHTDMVEWRVLHTDMVKLDFKGDVRARGCQRNWGPICCWELVTGVELKCGACLSVIIDEPGLTGWSAAGARWLHRWVHWWSCEKGSRWQTAALGQSIRDCYDEALCVSLMIRGTARFGW